MTMHSVKPGARALRCGCVSGGSLPPYFCAAHEPRKEPLDKPENYSPHTIVTDRTIGLADMVEHIDYGKTPLPEFRGCFGSLTHPCDDMGTALPRDPVQLELPLSMPIDHPSVGETFAPIAETVCEEANRIVYGDREKTYGHPALNFDATARYWNAYVDNKRVLQRSGSAFAFDARDVARMMVLLKMARQQHSHKRDNLVDAIGYVACEAKIDDYER